jgi:hypothetical protein
MLLLVGTVILVFVLIYFVVCDLQASVFQRLGFVDKEIQIGKVELKKYFSK